MHGQPGNDREWEHWPGRKPADERRRGRLMSLFTPTDQGEAEVEALILERGREIEARTEQLATTIAGLERREDEAVRLRASVEEMLLRGSAELDQRHAELHALATELGQRAEQLAGAESDLGERRRELGAVELRRAALERQEKALTEREALLERIAAELTARERTLDEAERRLAGLAGRERELDARAAELASREERLARVSAAIENEQHALSEASADMAQRERAVADLEATRVELDALAASLADRAAELDQERSVIAAGRHELGRAVAAVAGGLGLHPGPGTESSSTHVLFVPGDRYRLMEMEGQLPRVGAEIEVDGARYAVVRTGRSPVPGDGRLYAYLEPAAPSSGD